MKLKAIHPLTIYQLKDLIHSIVTGAYKSLELNGRSGRLTSDEIAQAVSLYKRKLIDVPDAALEDVKAIPVIGSKEHWVADIDLWTLDGRSDFTLSVTVQIKDDQIFITIDDLHVL